ncbi:LOW QUALITY PROTEIN: uncharacterized protein [Diabrotica undecimpunctata]|uniref:LOW QUALITY PROTEIN: uncharacterized protein n=1 Tax=Diabrotica undecimpunctata TaxID=50387 RepID=UPI003B636A17
MVMCWAPNCNHYNVREKCKFYRFPKNTKTRNLWIKLTRRTVEPGPGAFLCSCHFVDGKKENGPTLFVHNEGKTKKFPTPEKRTRAKKEVTEIIEDVLMHDARSVEEPQPSTSTGSVTTKSLALHAVVDAENYFLRQNLQQVSEDLKHLSEKFSFENIRGNDRLILLYTGLPTEKIFTSLFDLLKNIEVNYYYKWKVEKIRKIDQLLMTLMKLRQNFPHEDLAVRFSVAQATVSNIVTTWLHVLHEVVYKQLMGKIPSRNKNKLCLPNCFSSFTNCRIILDCTEVYTSVSRASMATQKLTYSSYKHRNTCKGLVGVAPNGVVTFVSCLYPGSTSDKKIVKDCGILDHLEAGDLILADKGFLIKDIVPSGVHVNIPPFLTTAQFTPEQVRQTECIARARIHVERAIRRMKIFKILDFIPYSLLPHADAVFQVIGALTNMQYPLIKEVEQFYPEGASKLKS